MPDIRKDWNSHILSICRRVKDIGRDMPFRKLARTMGEMNRGRVSEGDRVLRNNYETRRHTW